MGNLRSVQKAVEQLGFEATVSDDPKVLSLSSHLILPGVGAFGDAMAELNKRDLVPFLRSWADSNKPLFGICLGMQLLFDTSEEGGNHKGLSILRGKVIKFQPPNSEALQSNPLFKIPHMGWNQVATTYANDEMLEGIQSEPYVYFVHSYYVQPENEEDVWLRTDYGSLFCSAVRRGNLFATQFHPEKSQKDGLQMLRNFLKRDSHF